MSSIDDLLREFRADAPGPAEGAAERILERASRAAAQPEPDPVPQPPHRRPRWSRTLRWALVPVTAAAVASVAIAIAPTQDATHAPSLLERAEAAIAPAHRIVALSIKVRSTTSQAQVVNPNRTISMRQWTLAGAGRAISTRILISEGPLDRPPTDEDSTMRTNRNGDVIDQRSWTPLFVRARDNYDYPQGGGRGELEIGGPATELQGPLTLVERLRDAYRDKQLEPTGRTADGDLRFRSESGDANACSSMEFVLDAKTLLPRRIELASGPKPCAAGAPPANREIMTIGDAQSLPATAANRQLLAIGDWPTARTVKWAPHGEPKPLDRVPPVPELDEG